LSKRRTVQAYLAELPTEAESFLPLSAIGLVASQPRRYFEEEKLQRLAESIKRHGIIEPLLVRPFNSTHYQLVAGERRYRAAQLLELDSVPVVIRDLNDEEALAFSLVENLVREDLNPVEETEGILALLSLELSMQKEEVISLLYRLDNEQKGKATNNVIGSSPEQKVQELFEGLGQRWQSFVNNRLPLLNLPESLLAALRQGCIAYTKAKAIGAVKQPTARDQLLDDAIKKELSLSQIKEQVKILNSKKTSTTSTTSGIREQVDRTYSLLKKSKAWTDPLKQKKLSRLLTQIEALLSETNVDISIGQESSTQSS
jgi:ParB family transcriptional regulator, chromosome partitioning protein